MKKKVQVSEEIKKTAKDHLAKERREANALKTQERLKRRKESNAYIPYTISTTVLPGPKSGAKIIIL
jgi:hypothetical protein